MAGGNESVKAQLHVAEEQRMASRDLLLRPHTKRDEVLIESLGASIRIKSISFEKREAIQDLCKFGTEAFDQVKYTALMMIECIEEPKLTKEDVDAIRKQDIRVIDEISTQIAFVNLPGGDADEGKDSSRRTPNSDSDSS